MSASDFQDFREKRSGNNRDLDLFGEMISVIIEFGQAGFDTTKSFRDWINSEEMVLGNEMFTPMIGEDDRWLLSEQSMLADPDIKAIVIDRRHLAIETAAVNWPEFTQVLVEDEPDVNLAGTDKDRRIRVKLAGQRRFEDVFQIVTKKVSAENEPESFRSLWIADWKKFSKEKLRRMVEIADTAYTNSFVVFKPMEDDADVNPVAVASEIGMDMEMSLSQQLKLEQRPRLAIEILPTTILRQEMNINMAPIMTLQMRLLNMTLQEIILYGSQLPPEDQNKLAHVIEFVMAKVFRDHYHKDTGKWLPWKSARIIVKTKKAKLASTHGQLRV